MDPDGYSLVVSDRIFLSPVEPIVSAQMTRPGEDLVHDAVDMHVHPLDGGEFSVRLANQTVQAMADSGMQAVLLKPHFIETTMVASLIDHLVPDIRSFGGLIMERSAGGINPHVVKNQIRAGAKKIWMPLMTQNFWDKQLSHPRGYLGRDAVEQMEALHGPFWSYLNDAGEIREDIRDELRHVLEIIAEANVVFDTGHASAEESLELVKEAADVGVDKIVVDHPLAITKQATIEQQQEMVELGAYMEQSWAKMQPMGGGVDPEKYAEAITAVGPENTVLVTDYAAGSHPPPAEAMREYVVTMMEYGISEREIEMMIKDNPRDLLDL